ncbi:MAG TPA: tail fiber domain-containing protein [Panacibacter sp.]|nr:tail fiber domain-containing protein [Panacibacter sp.]HNP43127.1 tail fiber domain-containing protein [Panacibacter sp.]
MKTQLTYATMLALSFLVQKNVDAQNIFPNSGRTGIYTTTPVSSLQVAGGARFGKPAQYLDIDSATGNLSFGGNASLRVGGNKYAFQYSGNPNYGLFFNQTNVRYEFRDGAAIPVFYVDANTGAGVFSSTVRVGAYTLPATDGSNNQVLKTNGAGILTWSNDNNSTYTAGTGLSLVGTTFNNTAPDQIVSLSGSNGISVSGSYPNFTVSGANFWRTTGNSGLSAATNFLGTTDAVDVVFRSNNIEGMRLTNADRRLGLGTTLPSSKLHINAALNEDALRVQTNGTTRLFVDNAGGVTVGSTVAGPANGLYVNGNVGIGNSAPVNKLDVSGNAAFTGIVGIRGVTNAAFALNVNGSSSYGGINITDPVDNTALNISKSGINYGIFISKSSTASGVATIYSTNAGSGPGIYGQSASGDGAYGNSTSGYGVYGISSSSYGMYAYSSNYRALYAEGDPLYYTAYFNGDTYSTGSYLGSDAKLKKNIREVNNAMDIINQLKPKNYEFRNDGSYSKMNLPKGNHYGLIAQDVEKILPNLVKETTFETKDANPHKAASTEAEAQAMKSEQNEKIDFKAVNYTELIPLLVKALQEQDAKIDALTNELRTIKQSQTTATATETTSAVTVNSVVAAIKVQPNPAKSAVTISGLNKTGMINIIDMQGRQLLRQVVNSNNVVMNISSLSAGTYIIQYLDNGKTQTIKFVKE